MSLTLSIALGLLALGAGVFLALRWHRRPRPTRSHGLAMRRVIERHRAAESRLIAEGRRLGQQRQQLDERIKALRPEAARSARHKARLQQLTTEHAQLGERTSKLRATLAQLWQTRMRLEGDAVLAALQRQLPRPPAASRLTGRLSAPGAAALVDALANQRDAFARISTKARSQASVLAEASPEHDPLAKQMGRAVTAASRERTQLMAQIRAFGIRMEGVSARYARAHERVSAAAEGLPPGGELDLALLGVGMAEDLDQPASEGLGVHKGLDQLFIGLNAALEEERIEEGGRLRDAEAELTRLEEHIPAE